MKRLVSASVFAALLALAFYRDGRSQSSFVRQLAPGVYVRMADDSKKIIANSGWVVFRDYVLVIDANYPWGAREILKDIRRTTNKPIRFVFDTHYHADHSFGNSEFVDAGATLVCSDACMAESRSKNVKAWASDNGTGDFDLKQWRLEHPQVSFPEKMTFDDGEHRVELMLVGPGHTLGDSVAYLPKEKILFTGDLCLTRPGNNMADLDANPHGWVKALDRLSKMDITTLIPGHGGIGNRDSITPQRAYIAAMIEGIEKGIKQKKTAGEIADSLDLTKITPNGSDAARNRTSILAVYPKLKK